jgi:uncharacterized protein (DUF4415 family)
MEKKGRIVRATAEEIDAMIARGETYSDWARAEAMTQEEVERLADEDDGPLPEGWEDTVIVGLPERAQPVNIRVDAAVLRWFKAAGPGYQTRMNAVLRAYMQARQKAESGEGKRRDTAV